jgi:hypothetical protein
MIGLAILKRFPPGTERERQLAWLETTCDERRMVSITPMARGTRHEYGAAYLSASPGHDD